MQCLAPLCVSTQYLEVSGFNVAKQVACHSVKGGLPCSGCSSYYNSAPLACQLVQQSAHKSVSAGICREICGHVEATQRIAFQSCDREPTAVLLNCTDMLKPPEVCLKVDSQTQCSRGRVIAHHWDCWPSSSSHWQGSCFMSTTGHCLCICLVSKSLETGSPGMGRQEQLA